MNIAALYQRVGRWIYHHPRPVLFGCLLLTFYGAYLTAKIEIKADLTALLPEKMDSVRGLADLKNKYGGVGYLVLAIEGNDQEEAVAFIKTLVPELRRIPGVRYVNYRRPIDFFLKNSPLYLEVEDLKEIEQKLITKKEEMKKGAHPLFDEMLFSLDDGPSFSDILSRYRKKDGGVDTSLTEYYQNEEGTLFAVLVKPAVLSMNLGESRAFVQRVRATVDRLLPLAHGGIRVSYGGDFVKALEQERHLKGQMGRVSGVVLVILLIVLIVYYRRLSPVVSIGLPLLAAIFWTGGVVYFVLGHVNLVTGFSAAVLAGLGSDYGIYLLSRYLQERDSGNGARKSFENTFSRTSLATRGSAITTMIAFGVLSFSDCKGFSEFGMIGLIGTFLNLVAMHSFFPAILVLLERHKITDREKMFFPWSPRLRIGKGWLKFSLPIVTIFLSLGAAAACGIPRLLHVTYDRSQMENTSLGAYQVDKKVDPLFYRSLYPSVIMVPESGSPESEERAILNAIKRAGAQLAALPMIQSATGLTTFIPERQDEKAAIIKNIQKNIKDLNREMKPLFGDIQTLLKHFAAFKPETRISRSDLPPEITQLFTSPTGDGRLVYLFPKTARDNTERVIAFADQANGIRLDDGRKVTVLGDTMIIADIIRLVEREAVPICVLVLLLCFLDLILEFRSFKTAGFLAFMISFAALLYLGGMLLFKLRFNFFNLVAPPIIIGTGCDSFIHFYHRYREQKHQVHEVVNSMAPSIFVANLTTIIGFGGLIMTDNGGLRSTGWMVMIGVVAETLTALLFLPALLTLNQVRRLRPTA